MYRNKGFVFTEDGARAHTATANQAWLRANFPKTLDQHHERPASSYDPNARDYSLWATIEKKADEAKPKTVMGLKAAIARASREAMGLKAMGLKAFLETCKKMVMDLPKRLQLCSDSSGGPFE